jgi:hypothetical protein
VLWQDDAQVTTIVARKVYAGRQEDTERVPIPRAEVSVQSDESGAGTLVRAGASTASEAVVGGPAQAALFRANRTGVPRSGELTR